MFRWVVLISTVLGSLLCRHLFTHKQRMWIMPFCLAYTFGLVATVGSVGGFLHFIFTVWNFVIVMFLCNGFNVADTRNNPTWKAFMIFWVYMFVIVFTGYFPLEGACKYLQEFVNTFAAGYFFAMGICRTEGALRRSLIFMLIATWFTILYTAQHGGFVAANLDQFGRAGLDTETLAEGVVQNVNYIALTSACFLPFMLVLLLKRFDGRKMTSIKVLAGLGFVLMMLILIRTGSRNGALAVIPCLWYFFNATQNKSRKTAQIAIGVVIILLVSLGLGITMRGATNLRAFSVRGDDIGDGSALDRMTTGRWTMYANNLKTLTPFEMLIGKGLTTDNSVWSFDRESGLYIKRSRVSSGNAHSMYMTVFYRSGFVGSILFLVFISVAIREGFKRGERGKMALLFLGVWMVTGVGEAWGMIGGSTAILAGIAMGLLTNQHVSNSELMSERERMVVRGLYCY